ncbi:hypothetical protein B0J11DRAFT_512034 [Dendryphion nanum]|uniref:F-box domain-containing protein n=1 Tax=Dendryphion nanum TaxID=256645 RepID=A0A9P9I9S8_9PLEO|nr:hypothetical protein B0J11DRAFT_512034 [Dendryphion nanum]
MSTDFTTKLPPELWLLVNDNLNVCDQTKLRLSSKFFCDITTPSCFKTISFQLDEGNVAKLDEAFRKGPAEHFNDWKDHISGHDWPSLSDKQKEELYMIYEVDRKKAGKVVQFPERESFTIEQLQSTLARFTKLSTFEHRLSEGPWLRWQNYYINSQEDECLASMELSVVLRAIGGTMFKNLKSMTLHIPCTDFWETYELEGPRGKNCLTQPLQQLTRLSCKVDGGHHYGPIARAKLLGEHLCYATRLEDVSILFLLDEDSENGGTELLQYLTERRPWPMIRKLELGMFTDESTLMAFLDSVPTVRYLKLKEVILGGEDEEDEDEEEEDEEEEDEEEDQGQNLWKAVIRKIIRQHPIRLEYFDRVEIEARKKLRKLGFEVEE